MAYIDDLKNAMQKNGMSLPARMNFILVRKEGKFSIVFNHMKYSKCKIENVKFEDTVGLFWDGSTGTSLAVKDIETYEQMEKTLNELSKQWLDTNKEKSTE